MHNIKRIAEIAGVSTSTVSRVLNHHPYVSEATRTRVMEVIRELDYIPNINAVQLKVGRTKVIGIMTPTINNYYMQIIKGVSNAGKEQDYQVLIYQTEENQDLESAALELLRQKKVDGIVILRRMLDWSAVRHYTKYGPIVTCEPLKNKEISSIYLDHYEGFRIGLEHLAELGFEKIACTVGRKNSVNSQRRLQAYYDLLAARKLPVNEEWLLSGIHTVQDGMRAFAKLESLKERPHAIMTTNDLVACGIISAARSKGWKVPGDLAVVGFEADESQVADAMGLTNITNPLQRIGQEMFRTLYQQLNGQPLEPVSLAFELKVRQSTC